MAKRKSPSKAKKKAPVKKKVKPAKKASTNVKSQLMKVLSDINTVIKKIKEKDRKIKNQLATEQKKMFSCTDPTEKLLHFFQIEGIKIDTYNQLENDYRALSLLLNKAYGFALKFGGIVKDDFLTITQALSKGINLDLMEEDFAKMRKDLQDS